MRKIKKAFGGLQFSSSPLSSSSLNFNNGLNFSSSPLSSNQPFDVLLWGLNQLLKIQIQRFNMGLGLSSSSNPIDKQLGLQWVQDKIGSPVSNSPVNTNDTTGVDASGGDSELEETSPDSNNKLGSILGSIFGIGGGSIWDLLKKKKKPGVELSKAEKLGRAGNAMGIVGAASDLIGGFLPLKTEYSGSKGDVAQTMDTVYDSVSDAAMAFGPVGAILGGAMKGASLLGKGFNALGGGTSGMTTTDSILGSSFFNWNIGLINGFGGKNANTITRDNEAFSVLGSSYAGTTNSVDDALKKSGKKYGLFSLNDLDDANEEIDKAKRQLRIMSEIADETTDRFSIRNSMAAINGNRRRLNLQGGYNQSAIRVGRHGMLIQSLKEAKKINSVTKYSSGSPVLKKTRTIEELIEYAKQQNPRFIQRLSEAPRGILFVDDKGELTRGNVYLSYGEDDNGNAVIYPRILEMEDGKLKFLSSKEAWNRAVANKNILIMSPDEAKLFFSDDPEFGQAYKRGWPEMFKANWENDDSIIENLTNTFKEGGTLIKLDLLLEININNLSIEFRGTDIEEVLIDNILPEFREGGKFNIIPEGALHARKHNMENAENLTKKGIPVIDNYGDLQCEIEREEIIFRLEVTEKLEELAKDGSDEAAIEAGKLLVLEILYNTIDNTNSLI